MFSNKLPVCSIYCINFNSCKFIVCMIILLFSMVMQLDICQRYGISSVHAQSISSSLAFRFGKI